MIKKNALQWLILTVGQLVPTALIILGGGLISWGAGMIYPPVGVITAGGLAVLAGVLLIKGGGGDG